jgi:hypothetical protein
LDNVVESIIATPTGLAGVGEHAGTSSRDKEATFLAMYLQGLQQCEQYASTLGNNTEGLGRIKRMVNEEELHKGCRGRTLLHSLTGMTVWPFGPVESCTTHSTCWSVTQLLAYSLTHSNHNGHTPTLAQLLNYWHTHSLYHSNIDILSRQSPQFFTI